MRHLAVELALRLSRVLAATIIGAIVYLVAVGPLGVAGSATFALVCWLVGAAAVLLLERSPI